jgi:hypothetical protein
MIPPTGLRAGGLSPAPTMSVQTVAGVEITMIRPRRSGPKASAKRQMSLVTRARAAAPTAATDARKTGAQLPGAVGPEHPEQQQQVARDDPRHHAVAALLPSRLRGAPSRSSACLTDTQSVIFSTSVPLTDFSKGTDPDLAGSHHAIYRKFAD